MSVVQPLVSSNAHAGPLPLPAAARPLRLNKTRAASIVAVHLLALLAFDPRYFTTAGLTAAAVGVYVYGTLGINLCYHRLLTHRSFRCPLWLEHCFAVLGVCCLEGQPARWAATHRVHHRHSDAEPDPHSPLAGFLWAHLGWLMVRDARLDKAGYKRYVRDLLRDPFYARLGRGKLWAWVYIGHAALYYLVGLLAGWLAYGSLGEGARLGMSLLVWGVFVRTVLVWHITWSVNSATHVWGYRTYDTPENSRNNWFVALISNGEGWHNNHHADQRCAAHGRRWWELDVTWLTVLALEAVGLAWDVRRPRGAARVLRPAGRSALLRGVGRGTLDGPRRGPGPRVGSPPGGP